MDPRDHAPIRSVPGLLSMPEEVRPALAEHARLMLRQCGFSEGYVARLSDEQAWDRSGEILVRVRDLATLLPAGGTITIGSEAGPGSSVHHGLIPEA